MEAPNKAAIPAFPARAALQRPGCPGTGNGVCRLHHAPPAVADSGGLPVSRRETLTDPRFPMAATVTCGMLRP